MTISPMHNYVLVRVNKPEQVERESGLAVAPDLDRRVVGTVVGIGPEVMIDSFRVGDTILFPPYGAGQSIRMGLEEYVMYLDHEVLGVFAE